jgi:hypothetical protein
VPDATDRVHQAAVRHLDTVKAMLAELADQAGIPNPDAIACQLQILALGAIVSATRGDRDAALHARQAAEQILHHARDGLQPPSDEVPTSGAM